MLCMTRANSPLRFCFKTHLSSAGRISSAFHDLAIFLASTARECICPSVIQTAKTTPSSKELLWLEEPYVKTTAGALNTKPPGPNCSSLQSAALQWSASTKSKDAALTDAVFRHVRKRHHFFRLSQVKLQHIWVPYCMFWNNGQFLSAAPLISLAPYGRQQVKRSAQRLCRSFPGTHSLCYLAQSLGWENALCFIKAINYEAPGGTMLASHPQLSVCKTHKGRCLLEQYRCWPGWYLLKQWTGCNWLLNAVFTLTDIWLLRLQMLLQSFSEPDSLTYQPAVQS